jgi:hypothetical protein
MIWACAIAPLSSVSSAVAGLIRHARGYFLGKWFAYGDIRERRQWQLLKLINPCDQHLLGAALTAPSA